MTIAIEPKTLRARWDALLEEEPRLRIRRAAQRLGVSEAELLATKIGEGVTRLEANWVEFYQELPRLGRVMVLTRNERAVHEVTGSYGELSFEGPVGLALGEIDLRIFINRWRFGFAVETPFRDGVRRSLQFFDAQGTAVHKVYMVEESELEVYQELVERYMVEDQTELIAVEPPAAKPAAKPDAEIDVEGFQEAWRGLKDVHDFFMMLMKYGVERMQAMRLAPEGYTTQVPTSAAVEMLEKLRDEEVPFMTFVGNDGCIQIFTGTAKKLVRAQGWFNILDPGFNLHLRDDEIREAWIVRKPTVDGIVTSLEIYDEDGEMIGQFFGKRQEGQPEDERWRAIVESMAA